MIAYMTLKQWKTTLWIVDIMLMQGELFFEIYWQQIFTTFIESVNDQAITVYYVLYLNNITLLIKWQIEYFHKV